MGEIEMNKIFVPVGFVEDMDDLEDVFERVSNIKAKNWDESKRHDVYSIDFVNWLKDIVLHNALK